MAWFRTSEWTSFRRMRCCVGLSVLLIAVACAENCSTWFYPAGDGQCVCGSRLGTVIVCNNETQGRHAHVSVLDSYCLKWR